MKEERTLGVGAGSDGRTGPVDRGADKRLILGIADHALQILRTERTARGEGEK